VDAAHFIGMTEIDLGFASVKRLPDILQARLT
jgi:hypothetical protein